MPSTAIILAGGMGTRLRSVLPELPKPMAPINGRPFLEYQMDYWIDQGINRFILSVGYKKEIIISHFGKSYRHARVQFVEEDIPKGTGGGLLLALQNEDDPIFVLNGDTFFQVNLIDIKKFHLEKQSDLTIALFKSVECDRYMGLELLADDSITSLKSGTSKIRCLANGGVYLINPAVFKASYYKAGDSCSFENDLVPELIKMNHKVYGFEANGFFIDIGIPQDYYRAASVMCR